jgi:hypothetical protein
MYAKVYLREDRHPAEDIPWALFDQLKGQIEAGIIAAAIRGDLPTEPKAQREAIDEWRPVAYETIAIHFGHLVEGVDDVLLIEY